METRGLLRLKPVMQLHCSVINSTKHLVYTSISSIFFYVRGCANGVAHVEEKKRNNTITLVRQCVCVYSLRGLQVEKNRVMLNQV